MSSTQEGSDRDELSRANVPRSVPESLFGLLERLCVGAGIPFDRIQTKRAIGESIETFPGDPSELWYDWLTTVGPKIGLRITRVHLTLAEIFNLIRPNDPILVVSRTTDIPAWVLLESSLRTVLVWNGADVRIARSKLVRELGLSSRQDSVDAFLVQPIAPCEGAATVGHATSSVLMDDHEHGVTPLRRLLAFFRPEWSDIRVVLIFAIFVGIFSLATPIAVEALVTTVMFGNLLQPLVILSLTLLVFLAGSAAMRATQIVVMEILQRRVFVRVVDDFAYRLPRTPVAAFDRHYPPELINRFFETVTLQKIGTFLILDGMAIAIQMTVGMLVLAFYHPWLIGFDIFLLLMLLIVVFVLGRGAVDSSILESRAKYATLAWLQDVARCTTTFRGQGASEFAFDRADQLATDYVSKRDTHFSILFRQVLFLLGLEAVLSTVLLGLGGWLVIHGQMTLGQLVAAELIVTMIVGSLAKLGKHVESYYDLSAGIEKLGHVFDLPMEAIEGRSLPKREEGASVEFHGVQLIPGKAPVWSFRVEAGEHVSIQSREGDGHLIADMILGLRRPSAGSISIDGVDLRELSLDAIRGELALIRDVEVFEGSVEENVHVGRPEVYASDVQHALEVSGLWDTIRRLPNGVRTELTRGDGFPLRGTELQKLMLARALAGSPRVLVIDHGLDSLRVEECRAIFARLTSSGLSFTIILMTQREELLGSFRLVDPSETIRQNELGGELRARS